MCKSMTYQSKQSGILNFQCNLVSIPWLVLGMTMVALLWLLLTLNKHCKRRKRRQALLDHNIQLQNHKMSFTPFFAQAFSQFAPPPCLYLTASQHHLSASHLSLRPEVDGLRLMRNIILWRWNSTLLLCDKWRELSDTDHMLNKNMLQWNIILLMY